MLIALYAFIITPSQWWHHHSQTISTSKSQPCSEQQVPSVGEEQGTYCQICSHHYSYYSNEVAAIELIVPSVSTAFYKEAILAFSHPPLGTSTDRGPPTLIFSAA
ncbi:MAG: hypothetical protein ACK54Y_09135 [Bacteroidota bacterium]|jgi:hypothetical protein